MYRSAPRTNVRLEPAPPAGVATVIVRESWVAAATDVAALATATPSTSKAGDADEFEALSPGATTSRERETWSKRRERLLPDVAV